MIISHEELRNHVGHVGLYIMQIDGTVQLRCFARLHGGNDILILEENSDSAEANERETLLRKDKVVLCQEKPESARQQ